MLTALLVLALQALLLPRMVDIPAGTFWMGTDNPPMEDWDEAPRREVKVEAFRMSATEITNAQYEAFDPTHKRGEQGFSTEDDEAVIMVSWDDAMAYCRWLSEQTGKNYRLPTEAEWEYACRAGTTTALNSGKNLTDYGVCPNMAKVGRYWYNGGQNSDSSDSPSHGTAKVGSYQPNAWGLYDMHGNVWEWCLDWYGSYDTREAVDPAGLASGSNRVLRGGSWYNSARNCRSAYRDSYYSSYGVGNRGFRLCCPAGVP